MPLKIDSDLCKARIMEYLYMEHEDRLNGGDLKGVSIGKLRRVRKFKDGDEVVREFICEGSPFVRFSVRSDDYSAMLTIIANIDGRKYQRVLAASIEEAPAVPGPMSRLILPGDAVDFNPEQMTRDGQEINKRTHELNQMLEENKRLREENLNLKNKKKNKTPDENQPDQSPQGGRKVIF